MRSSRRSKIAWILVVAMVSPLLAQAPKPKSVDEERALLIEYLVTKEKSWRARNAAQSWRTETTRYDGDTPVTTTTETQCPDSFHLRTMKGNEVTDFYSVAGTEYRLNNGKWVTRTASRGFFYCASPQDIRRMQEDRRSPEEIVMDWADQVVGLWQVEKGPIRTIRGEKCQEWKNHTMGNPAEHRDPSTTTECYALSDSHLVHSDGMTGPSKHPVVTVTYDWNKAIVIKPPQ